MSDEDDLPYWEEMEALLASDEFLAAKVEQHMAPYRGRLSPSAFRHNRAVLVETLTEHDVFKEMLSGLRPRTVVASDDLEVQQPGEPPVAGARKKPAAGSSE